MKHIVVPLHIFHFYYVRLVLPEHNPITMFLSLLPSPLLTHKASKHIANFWFWGFIVTKWINFIEIESQHLLFYLPLKFCDTQKWYTLANKIWKRILFKTLQSKARNSKCSQNCYPPKVTSATALISFLVCSLISYKSCHSLLVLLDVFHL